MASSIHGSVTTEAARPAVPSAAPRRRSVWQRFLRTKTGPLAAGTLLAIIAASLLAPTLAPHDPLRQHLAHTLEAPGRQFLLGTDDLGRDLFSRLLYGGRVTTLVAFVSVGASVAVGVPAGILSGVVGGRLDVWLMHVANALLSFPSILLAFVIAALIGPSVTVVMLAVAVVFAPRLARFARGQTMVVREALYVEAARAFGVPLGRLMFRHILPNIAPPVLVEASLQVGYAVLVESSMSFLGAGIQPPHPSWGLMIKTGFGYIDSAPWIALIPGLAILVLALAANQLGDALRDTFDPRLRL